jgi:glycosyltransferase involved in cell wall biosynthesis
MKYSIITINYNNCDGLRKTIESVISQTYKDYEFIVIDGGSTDGSREILQHYSGNIDYWVSEIDEGIYNAMNKGVRQAKGDYLNFMNSGDAFYDSDVLASVEKELGNFDIIIGKEFHQNTETGASATTFLPSRISMVTFFVSYLPHQSGFIRRSLFDNFQYDENLRIVGDWKFYMQQVVLFERNVKLIDIVVSKREQGGISNANSSLNSEERLSELKKVLPPGVYKDYNSLAKLDKTTLYKLFDLCDNENTCRWLTICIKLINRFK